MSPLIPRHRPLTSTPVQVKVCCLRLQLTGSASGTRLLRGYFYVHVCYDPDFCSPALRRLCRWASEGNVSVTPCHPSYMALVFTMTGLSPVRKQYPSLGTPIVKSDPMSLYWHLSKTLSTNCGLGNELLQKQGLTSIRTLWIGIHYPVNAR